MRKSCNSAALRAIAAAAGCKLACFCFCLPSLTAAADEIGIETRSNPYPLENDVVAVGSMGLRASAGAQISTDSNPSQAMYVVRKGLFWPVDFNLGFSGNPAQGDSVVAGQLIHSTFVHRGLPSVGVRILGSRALRQGEEASRYGLGLLAQYDVLSFLSVGAGIDVSNVSKLEQREVRRSLMVRLQPHPFVGVSGNSIWLSDRTRLVEVLVSVGI